ncbi:MAG TPA: DUF2752 domain-containing protein [Cytophagaceae bacterium]|jgi:hypothetical protein|nr:DUF2752 domain-containing protein [Cytophagaceae bacterium]
MDKISPSKIYGIFIKYSAHNLIYSVVGGYFILSLLLYTFLEINICIPCLFTLFFGHHCWGCGMTHAILELIKLNFTGAYDENPLVFIVLPAGIYYIAQDFLTFLKKENTSIQK